MKCVYILYGDIEYEESTIIEIFESEVDALEAKKHLDEKLCEQKKKYEEWADSFCEEEEEDNDNENTPFIPRYDSYRIQSKELTPERQQPIGAE